LIAPALTAHADFRSFDRQTAAVDKALAWLSVQQQPDGSWSTGFGHPAGITIDALHALRAAGRGNADALTYLTRQAAAYCTSAAATGKLVAGLVAAGLDPRDIAGFDAVAKLESFAQNSGAYGDPTATATLADQAWAMIGLAALRAPAEPQTVSHLMAQQNPDGGWGWTAGQQSDPDSTALALQALAALGVSGQQSAEIQAARAYLKTLQGATGAIESWGAPNASSTAYAMQALVALGEDPLSEAWQVNRRTLLDGLLALQTPDGGLAGYDGAADLFSTAQAIPALTGRAFPLAGPVPALEAALGYMRRVQLAEGGLGEGLGADALLALASTRQNPAVWKNAAGQSLLDEVMTLAEQADNAGKAGRLLLALARTKADLKQTSTPNLVAVIESQYDPATGQYDPNSNVWNQAYALLALAEVGAAIPTKAVGWLAEAQKPDGGWPWAVGFLSDSNSTALSVQALVACGYPSESFTLRKAAAYLRSVQAADGGFRYDTSALSIESDGNSTALVMQALLALGLNPTGDWRYARPTAQGIGMQRPLDRLYALQTESGAFAWLPESGDNPLATLQVIPLLAGEMRTAPSASLAPAPAGVTSAGQRIASSTAAIELGAWGPSLEAWRKGLSLTGVSVLPATPPTYSGLAAVVMQFDADRTIARIVPLVGDSPSGWDVLQGVGVPLGHQQGLVCRIADVGCPTENCFCGGNSWWSYWHLGQEGWQMAMTGATGYTITDRAAEGWRWGPGDPPVDVQATQLFDPQRLSPGIPRIVFSGNRLIVRVDYQGDANQDAEVRVTVSSGTDGSPARQGVALTRLAAVGLFAGAVDAEPAPGEHQVCLSYADPDGVNGSARWCVAVTVPPSQNLR
jgi:prenyltransferase beta subunit